MNWTALVPLKGRAGRKSRLAPRFSCDQRLALSEAMAAHVLHCLTQSPSITRIVILSPDRLFPFDWQKDEGRGLNAELGAFRDSHIEVPLLVIHGDLPLLGRRDIALLLEAAEIRGAAVAPDRHGSGTNALALFASGPFTFAFGAGSRARHTETGAGVVLERSGLSIDVDTPADLDLAVAQGMKLPAACLLPNLVIEHDARQRN